MSTPIPELTPAQSEAIADILVLATYADDHLSLPEEESLQQKVESLSWGEGQSPSSYLPASIGKVRKLENAQQIEQFLTQLAKHTLTSEEVRHYTFTKVSELLRSDGIVAEETAFLQLLNEAFVQGA